MNTLTFYYPRQPGYEQTKTAYFSLQSGFYSPLSGLLAEYFEIPQLGINPVNVIPDGCDDIIIVSDTTCTHSYLSPSLLSTQAFRFRQDTSLFGIRFLPGAASRFLQDDHFHQYSTILALPEIWPDFHLIEEQLSAASHFTERCIIMDTYLFKKLHPPTEKQQLLQACLNWITAGNGHCTVKDLALWSGFTDRYIRKIFASSLGCSPKEMTRIIRMQALLTTLTIPLADKLPQIATNYGFSDQSHMNRECQHYFCTTAGQICRDAEWYTRPLPRLNHFFE